MCGFLAGNGSTAVSSISWRSYMMPCVLYSGKTTRSMPGKPSLMPSIIRAMLRALSRTSLLGVQARHLVIDDGDADGVGAAGNVSVMHGCLSRTGFRPGGCAGAIQCMVA